MAKMKYSEIPRDLSSDSIAAYRLAQGSPDRDKWKRNSSEGRGSPESGTSSSDSPPVRLFHQQLSSRRSTSAFRSHCLGSRKESPEPQDEVDGNGDAFVRAGSNQRQCEIDQQQRRSSRRGASPAQPTPYMLHHSLPRSAGAKSSSLPASARSGLSVMLCVDGSAMEHHADCPVQSIVNVSAESVAAQLTLLVVPVFQKIQPEELTSCGWCKSNKLELAPNVVAMTRHFNHVSFWTVQEILNEPNVRARADIVSHFIRIAKKLHELNNLHTLMAVVSALRSAPIYRLQKTWATVAKKDVQLLERLADLFSDHNNSEKLRQHMDSLKLPCVPYLGLFLSDVNFIDVAHPHHGGLESQRRQLQMNNLLRILANYQQSDYSFLPVKNHVMEYLRSAKYIEELQKLLEDDQYKLSLKLEPSTPPSSTGSKESFYDVKTAMGQLNVSPKKAASVRKSAGTSDGSSAGHGVKFVPGHTKSRSLGTNIFRNGPNHAPSYLKENEAGSGIWRHSLANHGFDSTLRNLIDDSVQEESTTTTTTSSCGMNSSPRHSLHGELDPSPSNNNDNHSVQGSDHSLSGLDSPLPPPPIRCCCIQGCVRKKAVLKDGRRPAVSAWQRYWIQLSGSNLLFYQPKHLRGSDRSDFRRRPFKAVSITGWSVERHHSPRHPDSVLLTNTQKGDAYKLRIVCPDAIEDWLNLLMLAIETPAESSDDAENLMSFE